MQFGASGGHSIEEVSTSTISFPVHSLVLCINSSFFKKLLVDSDMKEARENKIILHVNPGDSEYVKLLIHSFYNFNVLNNIDTFKLLKVLEYGDRYMCDALVKQGLAVIKNLKVATLTECNALLDRLMFFESSLGHILEKDFFSNVRSSCGQFLIKTFTPIECTIFDKLHSLLSFSSLLMLLKSNDCFAFSENSVVTFLLKWFEADESRQTEKNIEALLSECRYEHMNVAFLINGLSHTNPILSKWSGYLNWFIKAIAYPSVMSYEENGKRSKRSQYRFNARYKRQHPKKRSSFQNEENLNLYEENICNHKYIFQMNFNAALQKFTTHNKILYGGFVLQPAIIFSANQIMDLEMQLSCINQGNEIKNFILEIPFEIMIYKENVDRDSEVKINSNIHGGNIILTEELVIKFCNSSLANTTLGDIPQAQLTAFQTVGIVASFKFTR